MGKTIDIGGRIHNPELGNIVTGANEILDDTKNKKQDVINSEVDAALEALDANKQDNLTFDQTPTESSTNPVTSGGVYAADLALQQAIEAILTLIPSAASALNQLADKSFVNSSIATASATFRGTYNLVSDLHLSVTASHQDIATALASAVSTADNNDYCFVQIPTSDTSSDIRVTERYKFNGTAWAYEYDLNNSGFTAQQWEAINSGITALLVTKLGALPTAAELATSLAGKQNVMTFDNVPVSGSDNPVKSGGLYQLFAAIDAKFPSDASSSNKLVAENRLAAYVTAIIEALDASFDLTSADGHVTFRMTQTNGVIASAQILTSDIASASALTTLGGRVSTNETDIANLQQLYNNLQQSKPVPVTSLPTSGQQQGVIYRLAGTTSYADYMWNGSSWVMMAEYNNGIDHAPKQESKNFVLSYGINTKINQHVTRIPGVNLIDPKTISYNSILNYGGNVISGYSGFCVSDYILVNGKDIIANSWGTESDWAYCCVYDEDFNFIRSVAQRQYTYQAGDVYVRFSFFPSSPEANLRANYGTILSAYEPYVEYQPIEDIKKSIVQITHLYVATNGSDVNGDGSQLNPFATIYHANEIIDDNSEYHHYIIHIADGEYTDLQSRYAGSLVTNELQGVLCKPYVEYIGNVDNPENVIITWNGATGYAEGTFCYQYDSQGNIKNYGFLKCPFHVTGGKVVIKGFTFNCQNTRYALHIECSGAGKGFDWLVSDCKLKWGGCPDCPDLGYVPSVIGTGSGFYEKGHLLRCVIELFGGINTEGFVNHDSNYSYNGFKEGASITIESCDFANTGIVFRSMTDNIDGYNRCQIKNCINVSNFTPGILSPATSCHWRALVLCSDITDNVFETEGLLQ